MNMTESQWKLRQQDEKNFPMEEKPLHNKYQHQKKEINPKEQDCENHSLGSKQEIYTIRVRSFEIEKLQQSYTPDTPDLSVPPEQASQSL